MGEGPFLISTNLFGPRAGGFFFLILGRRVAVLMKRNTARFVRIDPQNGILLYNNIPFH